MKTFILFIYSIQFASFFSGAFAQALGQPSLSIQEPVQNLGDLFRASIETEKLLMRPISFAQEDRENFKRLCADNTQDFTNVCWTYGLYAPYRKFLFRISVLRGMAYPYFSNWLIFDKKSAEFLGIAMVMESEKAFTPEFAMQLLPEARGKGIGKEAGNALIKRYQEFSRCHFIIDSIMEREYLKERIQENGKVLPLQYSRIELETMGITNEILQFYREGHEAAGSVQEAFASLREKGMYCCYAERALCDNLILQFFPFFEERCIFYKNFPSSERTSFVSPPSILTGLSAVVRPDNAGGMRLMKDLGFKRVTTNEKGQKTYSFSFQQSSFCQPYYKQRNEL